MTLSVSFVDSGLTVNHGVLWLSNLRFLLHLTFSNFWLEGCDKIQDYNAAFKRQNNVRFKRLSIKQKIDYSMILSDLRKNLIHQVTQLIVPSLKVPSKSQKWKKSLHIALTH